MVSVSADPPSGEGLTNKNKMKTSLKSIARIFEDVGGFYYSREDADFLDMRGCCYPSRAAALRACRQNCEDAEKWGDGAPYTHARIYGRVVKL
jgi:hypothetical protein